MHFLKAQVRINLIPVPAGCLVRVHGYRFIAKGSQVGGHGRRFCLDVLLVGDAAGGKKGHGIPRQVFKLGICSISPQD